MNGRTTSAKRMMKAQKRNLSFDVKNMYSRMKNQSYVSGAGKKSEEDEKQKNKRGIYFFSEKLSFIPKFMFDK